MRCGIRWAPAGARYVGRMCTLAVVGAILSEGRPAEAIVLPATDSGFVTMAGGSSKGDGTVAPGATFNYSAGREDHYATGALFAPLAPMDRKNYFVFDLTGVGAPIASAALTLYAGTYESSDPFETWGLAATGDHAGALGDITALKAGVFGDFDSPLDPLVGMAASLYAKLADGPMPLAFGSITAADDDTLLTFTFTPAGVGYLNSHLGGPVVLGGLVPSAMPPAKPQSVFGFTEPDIGGVLGLAMPTPTPLLSLTIVPETGACGMLAAATATAGAALMVGRRNVRQRLKTHRRGPNARAVAPIFQTPRSQ